MAGLDVGMRFVNNKGVGVGRAHAGEKIAVTCDSFAAEENREIVFDLSRHQNTPLAGGPFDRERRIAHIVFGDAASDEPSDQIAGALEAQTAILARGPRQGGASAALLVRRKAGAPALDRRKSRTCRRFQNDIPRQTATSRLAASIFFHSARISRMSSIEAASGRYGSR